MVPPHVGFETGSGTMIEFRTKTALLGGGDYPFAHTHPHCTRSGGVHFCQGNGAGKARHHAGYLVRRVEASHTSTWRRPMSLEANPVCEPAHEGYHRSIQLLLRILLSRPPDFFAAKYSPPLRYSLNLNRLYNKVQRTFRSPGGGGCTFQQTFFFHCDHCLVH